MIETRTETLWMENGIVFAVNKKVDEHDLEDARENISAANKLSEGNAYPLLVDIRQTKHISIEARKCYTSNENYAVTACAFVIDSPVSLIIAKMFMGINKTPFPAKFFRCNEKAKEWLNEFVVVEV